MILKYMSRKDWFLSGILAAIIVFQVYLDLRIPEYMNDITNSIQQGLPTDVVSQAGIGMITCAMVSLCVSVVAGVLAARIATSLSRTLRKLQFDRVQTYSKQDLDGFSIPSLVTRSTNDVYNLQQFIARALIIVVKAPVMGVWAVTKISGAAFDWTAVTVVTLVLVFIFIVWLTRMSIPYMRRIQILTDGVNRHTRENVEGMRVIRAYNAQEMQSGKLEDASDDVLRNNITVAKIMSPMHPVASSSINFLTLAIYWLGAGIIMSTPGQLDQMYLFSDMIVFSSYASQTIVAVMMFTGIIRGLPRAMVSAKRVEEVIDHETSLRDGARDDVPVQGRVEFRDVSFGYPGSDGEVLSGISFTAEPGQTVAIVGPTGSGKSSLVNLIPRLYDATGGSVLVDGVDVREYRQSSLRGRIGYVPQTTVIFTGSIAENVNYGQGSETRTEDDVRRALDVAQATDFIDSLPEGIEFKMSKHGRNVSGGQKQRISIARAVCKSPKIYIFDDSFSALDFKTDRDLRTALREETDGSTVIMVAQRIGTVMEADRIIVLDEGRIVGDGTHESLMRDCELYRDMAESQMGAVRWR